MSGKSGSLPRQSYRDQLRPDQRSEAERELFHKLLGELTSGQRNRLASYYRYDAAGEPIKRAYIAELIEGKATPDG